MYADTQLAPHPLSAALARFPDFHTDVGIQEADWFSAHDLLREDLPLLEQALAYMAVNHPQMDARTRGSYLIGRYSWWISAAAIATYLNEQRAPDMSIGNIALRFKTYTWHRGDERGEATRMEVRFLTGRFGALPSDPAADHPDATILPDSDALRDWLRTTLEGHLAPIIERIHNLTRLGRNAQWLLVADACAGVFLSQDIAANNEIRGRTEGLAFVKADSSPMKNPKTGYITLQYLDHCETFRARGGCCRYYTVSDQAEKCSTCVLRPPAERDEILLNYMTEKYAQPATAS